jgi:hypothetical protein
VPAPTAKSGNRFAKSLTTCSAPGTVSVISMIGIPAEYTVSAANRARSCDVTRTEGRMPMLLMSALTSSLFIDATFPYDYSTERAGSHFATKADSFLNLFMPYGKIQLAGGRHIRADQLQVGQLHHAVVALCIEKVHQRCAAMLISERNRVAHIN